MTSEGTVILILGIDLNEATSSISSEYPKTPKTTPLQSQHDNLIFHVT